MEEQHLDNLLAKGGGVSNKRDPFVAEPPTLWQQIARPLCSTRNGRFGMRDLAVSSLDYLNVL